jgi:hypothetical protein
MDALLHLPVDWKIISEIFRTETTVCNSNEVYPLRNPIEIQSVERESENVVSVDLLENPWRD